MLNECVYIFPYAFNRSHHDWLCFRPRSIETRAQEESLVQVYDFVQSSLEKKSNWKRRHLKRIHLAIHTYYISSQTSFQMWRKNLTDDCSFLRFLKHKSSDKKTIIINVKTHRGVKSRKKPTYQSRFQHGCLDNW